MKNDRGLLASWLSVSVGLMLTGLPCYGQGDRGLISGSVHDATGARVPGAAVRAINTETGIAFQTLTNADGIYTVPLLPPGTYTIVVEKPGFKKSEEPNVLIRINDRLTVDIIAQVGEITQQIQVDSKVSLLDASSGSIGTVVDNRRIRELPLQYGNPLMLQYVTNGVAFLGNPANGRPFDNATASQASVNGSQQATLEVTLDGVPNMGVATSSSGLRVPAYEPSVEFIQEYKVETSAYDASQGHAAGGFVNITIKSGTNDLHGSASGYLQNRALNSNLFFNNLAGQPKPNTKFHREGASLGGPLIRNRTFWFFGYEHMAQNNPAPLVKTVPTPAQRNGDFSKLLPLGSTYQLYDPATSRTENGQTLRDPFPGNIVPAGRFDVTGKKVTDLFPDPNQAGSADGGNNYNFGQGIEPDRFYTITSKVDHLFNERQRLSARFSINRRLDGPYRVYYPGATGNNYISKNRGGNLDYVYTVNPSTVVNLRYGITRFFITHQVETSGFDVTTLGLPANLKDRLGPALRAMPYFQTSGYDGFLSEQSDGNYSTTNSFIGTVSHTHGRHFLRMGVEYRTYQYNANNPGFSNGRFIFSGAYVNGPNNSSPIGPRGPGLAGLLLGLSSSGSYADTNTSFAGLSPYLSGHIQDDWKITKRLTLNLGLRYEYDFAPMERHDRSVAGFAFNVKSPIATVAEAAYAAKPIPEVPASQFRVNGGLTFPGVNGLPRQLWQTPANELLPRVGLAYQLRPNTVLRGGYGLFFDNIGLANTWSAIQSGFSAQTPVVVSLDQGVTLLSHLTNPFPDGFLTPPGNSLGLGTLLGQSVSGYNQNPKMPNNQRWSLGVQRQFARNWLVDVTYVGNRGTHLSTNHNIDGIPNQFLSTTGSRDQALINRLGTSVPNPFAGLLQGTNINGATTGVNQLLRPYPQFTAVTFNNYQGSSWYHSLQSKIEKRFSQGFTLMASWTWSKNMEAVEFLNTMDPRPSETISANDRTHRLSVNGIYELPFGKGRRFAAGVRGAAGKIVSGWQISPMYQVQSGAPLGFGDFIYYGNAKSIPLSGGQRTRLQWFNTTNFERSTAKQLASDVRVQPLRFSGVRSAGLNYIDGAIIKKTKVNERLSIDFRTDLINIANHTVFMAPDVVPTDAAFGSITTAYPLPRTIQFGLIARF